MYALKWVQYIPIIIGILMSLYGWVQSWDFRVDSTLFDVEDIAMNRTIRSYVFVISGFILIFIGLLLGVVMKYIHSLEDKVFEFKRELNKK